MMRKYDKIVRDRIPEVIEAAGQHAIYELVDHETALEGLKRKLSEELAEYLESGSLEELADLLEVMHGVAYHSGVSWQELEAVRLAKRAERGGFERGVRLLEVNE
ncbi:MAG TPA: nucleoside triphosphate pyrophosphohydrolase [Candidatus Fimadaptatus faecigallinarum]|uniref:Nucleoside triphosphate pyrophosphohydrolase n=1 Tax=Candidatus Fimadaptatus faecigallinarum TaxID=2840814 RepID=A0A9D1LRB1_9FIRM|nr:nucleoside triphosphate pyrophosphohydrolase [Candidatus Fimadaptatus faecigallinarum]